MTMEKPNLTAANHLTFPNEVTDSTNLSSIYRLTAVNFRLSAETLNATLEMKPNGTPAKLTAIPLYFLASHAAELFLKSALLKRGFTEDALKQYDYRHNLNSLLLALQDTGVSVTPDTVNLINGLHAQHKAHALRYSALIDDGQRTFLPPPSQLFLMLDELLLLTRISTQGV